MIPRISSTNSIGQMGLLITDCQSLRCQYECPFSRPGSLFNPNFQPMGLPSLPGPPFTPCALSMEIGCPPRFSFSAPLAQEPPPPYTPVQSTVTTVNQPTQLNFFNGTPGGAVTRVPLQGQPLTGNNPIWDNRMSTNGYNFGPAIPNHFCRCSQCKATGQ